MTEGGKILNHYDYLESVLPNFFAALGINFDDMPGIIGAHGDKCYGYKQRWEKAGIPFEKGAAIYLLSYVSPFSKECRETKTGWVPVEQWVIDNKDRFLPLLPNS